MRKVYLAFAAAGLFAPGAFAQEDDPGLTFDATLGVVSDYRYRGVSLSDEAPAVQLDATVASNNGLYGNLFVSTIDEYGMDADGDGDGAHVEVDYTFGWAFTLADVDVDVAVSAYTYPGGTGVDYLTIPLAVSRSFEQLTITLGYEYSPAQENLGDADGSYIWLGADWANEDGSFGFTSWVGHEDGVWAPGGKTDWSVGGYTTFDRMQLGLSVQGVDIEDDVTLVGSLSFSN